MKKFRKEEQFLEQIRRVPNISFACEKVGLSRNTVYRWKAEDQRFSKRLEEALPMGTESINDLAESCVIQGIKSGNINAAKIWLENNSRKYHRPKLPMETLKPEHKGVEKFVIVRNSPDSNR